ncbi:hypothetical protein [Bacillus atrophaeus]|uniref:hypothetical protein n=1 Tax=Bacillus atrophaeus TaxID=1452 RepID=UPI002E1D4BA0|nr:hypothetical protein [Bacillus atrophaeus]MED1029774.1 hypothetical protein [Bacillus atrophaeus]MED1117512.1 hypothetical protein [Bacillus atrophaeus]MED1131283.1 hypothetical protein [Bacillus atrophaeus]
MGAALEVNLIGISYGYSLDQRPLEVYGNLYLKTLYENMTEYRSYDMFYTASPIAIGVGEMFRIDKTQWIVISSSEPAWPRYIKLGGNLNIGGPRDKIISYSYTPNPQIHKVIFPNADSSIVVVAEYSITWKHYI